MRAHHTAAQRGFTLVELMIAATIGLLIMVGMTTMFVKNNKAQSEIEKANRQVENGRYGIQVLASGLRNAGFYGEFDPTVLAAPAALPNPCAVTLAELKAALPLPVQGYDNVATNVLTCLSDVRAGTDVLVLRHARPCIVDAPGCEGLSDGPFLQASLCNNPSELDSGDPANFYALDVATTGLTRHRRDCSSTAGSGTLAVVRRYQVHIYFVANNDNPGDGIPTLKRAELGYAGGTLAFTIVPLVEGIENLQLEHGIDTNNDAVPDLYNADPASANGCLLPACAVDNWRNVVAVRLNLLARNTEPTQDYTDSKSYVLGSKADGTANTVAAANDHYRRHVFQALINVPNVAGRKTP